MQDMPRTPKYYSGTKPTGRHIRDLIPSVLNKASKSIEAQSELILGTWGEIVGETIGEMCSAESFVDGVLRVKVKHATLHSLLKDTEKPRLLSEYKKRFPTVKIKNIVFFIG
ncbi:MAG: hypothetical protein SP1CHLAM54_05190 [Chlamydiia bacterium]|nr:hypothetical protein [Chlamydiia bacterium]MCH9615431.1 hypothetical protein [Chlamydiia bacterium]MCH9628247.1 hypothetical protein [Chlamydiia bacterium]